MSDLQGKRALVTGGTRGIGAAISARLLAQGATVTACYQSDQRAAEAFAEHLAPTLREHLELCQLDVSSAEAVEEHFRQDPRPLAIAVNCAGVRDDALLGMMSADRWSRVLRTNLDGAFYVSKQAVRRMLPERAGRVIAISSPAAHLGVAGLANYSAAKAGVEAMSRALACEVARKGITVNCVVAGFVETELVADLTAERLAELRRQVPLGRFATPEEIAACVLFLCSDEARYITGATIPVTGGINI
ncbi:MAG: SDR family oxidoreductase [Deltaproteobacteria bacterium]|nr:SDR family oxidoreductase [Deltaproteobacteria bacterium]